MGNLCTVRMKQNKNKKKNLLLLSDNFDIGGKEIMLVNILKNIDRSRFNVHLIILSHKGELIKKIKRFGIKPVLMSRAHKVDVKTILKLRRYIIHNRIDIIHTNDWIDSLYIVPACLGLSVIKIATVHGYEKGWHLFVHRKILNKFHAIIAVSKSLLNNLMKMRYNNINIFVVYNSYDEERFHFTKSSFLIHNPPKLVMVSRFDWCKQQEVVVRAVGLLKKWGIAVTLDFVGDGIKKYVEPVKRLVTRMNLKNEIKFLGIIKDVGKILPDYDIFIMSSSRESFGLSLVEAMAVGLPVIASDIDSFREILGNGKYGILFKTGDENSLAVKIKRLIEDKYLYREMALKARERADEFTPSNMIKKLEKIYELFF